MRFVIVSGSLSNIGKGVSASSIAVILAKLGLRVTIIKIDPYLNVDAGNISPYEHGEVFVTADGSEVDLDIGNYERFLDCDLSKDNNITTGKIYSQVIDNERQGKYLGQTVQCIPHLTDEIRHRCETLAANYDVCCIELGGSVGDVESTIFLEALRQLRLHHSVTFIHMTYVPCVGGEQKSKLTQQSVDKLMSLRVVPDIIFCRSDQELLASTKAKIALFCNTDKIFSIHNVSNIYHVPGLLHQQGFVRVLMNQLQLPFQDPDLTFWSAYARELDTTPKDLRVLIVGKYTKHPDSYHSLIHALRHASPRVNIMIVDKITEKPDGIVIPGGFGIRGVPEKLAAIQYARENKIPFLGICLGFQLALIEIARHVLWWPNADSQEFGETLEPIIHTKDRKMITGAREVKLQGHLRKIYGRECVIERFRHRYFLNSDYCGAIASVCDMVGYEADRVSAISLNSHPFFIGVQYHPEYISRSMRPSPLFQAFIQSMTS